MNQPKQIPTWDELIESMNNSASHPEFTGWDIYRHLNANYKELGSQMSRTLLLAYFKLPLNKPSRLHSCILMVALKMAEEFSDFRLPPFLQIWGYDANLSQEDRQRQVGKDGRQYLSLKERADRALQTYLLRHPEERHGEVQDIIPMVAVKVFETEKDGRKMRSVKMIAPDGKELLVDSHLFPCKPWEIAGRFFDVLVRTSKEGTVRAHEIVERVGEVDGIFPVMIGFVDRYDASHGHYHVFDAMSRHFVAENPKVKTECGTFVWFVPVIPEKDRFKSAIVMRQESLEKGRDTFGLYDAEVKYVDAVKGFFSYRITSPLIQTPEGTMTTEGTASLSTVVHDIPPVPHQATLTVGQKIRMIVFLTRGKDGQKRNHVAQVIP